MTYWIRIVKLISDDDDDEMDKISEVGKSVLQRIRLINEGTV